MTKSERSMVSARRMEERAADGAASRNTRGPNAKAAPGQAGKTVAATRKRGLPQAHRRPH